MPGTQCPSLWTMPDLHPNPMYTDSSFMDFGAWMRSDWLSGCWSEDDTPLDFGRNHLRELSFFDVAPRNINVLELWPVVVGLRQWAPYFR